MFAFVMRTVTADVFVGTVVVACPFTPIVFELLQCFAVLMTADFALALAAAVFRAGRLANSFPFAVGMLRRFGGCAAPHAMMCFVIRVTFVCPFGAQRQIFRIPFGSGDRFVRAGNHPAGEIETGMFCLQQRDRSFDGIRIGIAFVIGSAGKLVFYLVFDGRQLRDRRYISVDGNGKVYPFAVGKPSVYFVSGGNGQLRRKIALTAGRDIVERY